jgi:hypothetical protein
MPDNLFPIGLPHDDFDGDDDALDPLDFFAMDAFGFSLTVAESKRLIAKGLAADPRVQEAMENGMVAVGKGSTNAYVVEELLGHDIEKARYVLGRTVPEGNRGIEKLFAGTLPDVVFRQGRPVEGLSVADAVREMKPGDVVLKGANALDYPNRAAAVLIGHPEGGTMGTILGCVFGKGLHLIVPVGLEKQIAMPLSQVTTVATPELCSELGLPRLWPVPGAVFTEVEACQAFGEVEVLQLGAGGICGAEGAVWLLVNGLEEDVAAVREVVQQVKGEPSFMEGARDK